MLRGLDHIVIVVPDLPHAQESFRALGFTVVEGGRHPVGTHNALIALEDGAYIELIAFYEPSPNHRWWHPLQIGGGLVDFCMQTDDLTGDTAVLREAGVEIDGPSPLSRVRPDGFELKWLLSIPRTGYQGVAPFLIEDDTPREARIPPQKGHPNGAGGIDKLTVAVDNVVTVRGWYEVALGHPGQEVVRSDLTASGVRFDIGPHKLELIAPRKTASPLTSWLAARGPSPYAVSLTTSSGRFGLLDPGRTLGAQLSLVGNPPAL